MLLAKHITAIEIYAPKFYFVDVLHIAHTHNCPVILIGELSAKAKLYVDLAENLFWRSRT